MKLSGGKITVDVLAILRLKHVNFLNTFFFLCVCCQHCLGDLHFYVTKHHNTGMTPQNELCSCVPVQSSALLWSIDCEKA